MWLRALGFKGLILSIAVLAGCSARWVVKDYRARSGVVRYLNDGSDGVIESRRNDAFEKMAKWCQEVTGDPRFRIVRESAESKYAGTLSEASGSASIQTSGKATAQVSSWTAPVYSDDLYIEFRCFGF